jgi:hypothetical protein
MILLTWNGWGLNDPLKVKDIRKYIERTSVTMVGLLEFRSPLFFREIDRKKHPNFLLLAVRCNLFLYLNSLLSLNKTSLSAAPGTAEESGVYDSNSFWLA